MKNLYIVLVMVVFQLTIVHSSKLLEGLYCGKDNCYDVLNVTRESTKNEIAKNYRQLAKKFHPDLHRGEEAKAEAEINFKRIATAYEILRDDEARTDYDYMLDNPDAYYAHYYRYYRRRVAPKVDVRIVVIVTITIISIVQHFSAWQRYDQAIKYFMTVPKYRNKAMDMAQQQQKDKDNSSRASGSKKGKSKLSKSEQRDEQEKLIRKIIEEKMDIKGAYAKPEIIDILWIQIIIFPYTLTKYLVWYAKWTWNFTILRHEYGRDEKLYLIRKLMRMGQHQFNALEDDKIQEYLYQELWKKENFEAWKLDQEEEMKKSLADNPRYKQYRRYMKNHGPGRITFDD